MTSTVQEFRDRSRKTVTLPSGLTVEIRKVWLIDFFSLGELPLPGPEPAEGLSSEASAKSPLLSRVEADKYAARAVLMGAVAPIFVEEETEASENRLWIKELSYYDFQALAEAILSFSGLTKEAAADADKFRPDAVGKNGDGPGGEIRSVADGDHANGSGGILSESRRDIPADREKEKAH